VELLLRRVFPLVPVVTATVCASLGIAAAGHWLDARRTELPDMPSVIERPSTPQPSPPPAVAEEPPPPGPPPPARVKLEPLSLILVATSVASDERRSTATILSGPQVGVYGTGERLPGGGTLASVAAAFVEVERQGTRERVRLRSAAAKAPAATPRAEPRDSIGRAEIQALLADPAALAREGTRVRPGPDGVRVLGVRPDSTAARFGLENGDVIVSVDGVRPTTPDAALELVGRLRTAREMKVEIARRGQTVTRVLRIL
jgi:type II secretion system protein C